MGSLETIGVFAKRAVLQDALHGSVPINEVEYWLLQKHPLRRLHGVRQLGFLYLVYPTATHSRLSHSIGVMHIAGILAEKAAGQIIADAKLCAAVAEKCNWDSMKTLIQLSRLAGLLHDIGHFPYSHATEDIIEREGHYSDETGLQAVSRIYEEEARSLGGGSRKLKIHELLGYKIVSLLADSLEEELLEEKVSSMLEAAINSIWFPEKAEGFLNALGLKGGAAYIIRDLITHDVVDADRLDYLRRDAWHTGVIYGFTDVDRIYNGVRVKLEDDKPEVYYDISAQQSIEDVYSSRYKMYKTVYHHHKATALLIAYWRAFTGLVEHWPSLAPRDVAHLDLAGDLLNPRRLPELIVYEGVLFDDSTIDSALKAAATSTEVDKATRRWSRSLISDRRLLPISLVKRQDEIMAIITRKGLRGGIEEQASTLKEVVNVLLSRKDDVIKVVADEAAKHGIPRDQVNVDIIQRSIDSDDMKRGVLPSIYLTTLKYLSSIGFAQAYTHSENERVHIKLYKIREHLREKFRRILEDIYDCIVKRGSEAC